MKGVLKCVALWISVALWWVTPAGAAVPVDTLGVDLNPLIDQAARSKEQFAVNISHSASSSTHGVWTRHGATSTWAYNARVPTAISMSFHASGVALPASAVLTVTTQRTTVKYTARDVSRRGLWGRPMPGDTLHFSLSVNSSETSQVHFRIESLQAGYRSLGSGVTDHPHYQQLKKEAAASTGCTENYSCHATTANQGPAGATVALIIGNLYECTGTLLNDTSADGTPYVLTARHCETGQLGGGNPGAAATVSVYWDAVTPCGSNLGSIYDAGTIVQYGATTVLEQQDIWLIQLDTPPAAADAFYAGWDASGNAFSGGYTIHHALGENKQYVEWSGTDVFEQIPAATLNAPYTSTFWGVVNSVGNVGAGASGSALFSPNNQVAGSATLAELVSGENSAGVCPANPPPTPTASTVTALFTALSGVWTSTADPSSSTGSKTLQSLLDPGSTGQMTTGGLPTQPLTITASQANANTGDTVTLSWNAQGAGTCTSWGGATGDGWAGVQPASGSVQITNVAGGMVNYSLSCHLGSQIVVGTVAVNWDYIEPVTNLQGVAAPLMLGASTTLNWDANLGPCVATGGNSGDGWAGPQPASGSFSLTVAHTGITQYTLTCGTGARIATNTAFIDGLAPHITLVAYVTQIAAGSNFELSWFGNGSGGACSASGGSSTDGWALNNSHVVSNGSALITETVPGTYTYTLTCTGGGQSASGSATVVVTGDPPAISLTALTPEQQVGPSNTALNLLWTSNVSGCAIDFTSNSGLSQAIVLSGGNPLGAIADLETEPGPVTYTMECPGSLTATATINWVATPTPSVLSATTSSWVANVAYPVSWNAASGPCVGSGGASGDGWAGSKSPTGTQSVTESTQGTYVFTLVCGSGPGATTSQIAVVVPPPFIQIYPDGPSPLGGTILGGPLVWQSTVGPCTYLDGTVPNGNGEAVPPSGSATPTATVTGTYLFSLTCGSGASALYAATFAQIGFDVPTTLTASVSSIAVDGPVTLTWGSDGTSLCYATGGTAEAPWVGTLGFTSGSVIVTSRSAGTVTYGISCGVVGKTAQAVVNYVSVPATAANAPTPTVSFSASAATRTPGQSVSLVWSAKNADACSASGGASGDGWTGSLATSGSMSVSEASPGTVTYSITCTGAPPAAAATTTVVIQSTATSGAGTTGSHGGGGALDLLLLLGLTVPLGLRMRSLRRS